MSLQNFLKRRDQGVVKARNRYRRLLPGIGFEPAIATIAIISGKTKDKQMYDQRAKAQCDYESAVSGARDEEREQGREQGLLAGRIRTLQEILGGAPLMTTGLMEQSVESLSDQLSKLLSYFILLFLEKRRP